MAKIFIDAGHGGRDSGAVGHGLQEKHVVMKIARYTRSHLIENYHNADVRLSRTGDTTLSLGARTNAANNWGADVFVSIHINAGGGVGYEDFIYNGPVQSRTRNFQNHIHKHVSKHFSTNRGKKRANFYVLRNSAMPAVLTENGFIDNAGDAAILRSDRNLEQIGIAHAEAIAEFLQLKRKGVTTANRGGLTVSQYNELKNEIKELKSMIQDLSNSKLDKPSNYEADEPRWGEDVWQEVAKREGYFDGSRPHQFISRIEGAVVTQRITDNINDYLIKPLSQQVEELEKRINER